MFLTKIRNIFCVPDTKFVSATNVARAGKRGNICVGNNVSSFASTLKATFCLVSQQMLRARANEDTFVSATMCAAGSWQMKDYLFELRRKIWETFVADTKCF